MEQEFIEDIYFKGTKYGIIGTLLALIKTGVLNESIADGYINGIDKDEKLKGILEQYENDKKLIKN